LDLCILDLSSLNLSLSLLEVVLSSVLLFLLDLVVSGLLRLFLLNGLDQDLLVLEEVTLGEHVELVVKSLVDLSLLAEFAEESTEGSLSAHPKDLAGHSGVAGTLSLTDSAVSTFSLFEEALSGAVTGVDGHVLLENEAVLHKLFNVAAGGGQADLAQFLVVHPDAVAAALQHAGCESSL